MAFSVLRVFLTIGLLVPATGFAQGAPASPSVVVIATKDKAGPNLTAQVKSLIEKPLGKQQKVVPLTTYQKAAKRVGVKGPAVTAPESVGAIGNEAGVTHVIFIEGQLDKQKVGKKTKQTTYAMVKVIEVATGDVVFTNRYELKAKKIDAKIAGFMLTEITGALTKPATPPPGPTDNPSPAPPEAPPPPPAGGTADNTSPPPPESPPPPAGGEASKPAEGTASGTEPAPAPAPAAAEPAPAEPAPVIAALSAPVTPEPAAVSETPARRKRWRQPLHLGLGGIGLQRKATITAKGAKPPGYEGPLPGGYFQLAFFPLAIKGKGAMYEGLGLTAQGNFMRVETIVDDTTKTSVTSDVVGAGGGLAYRLVFWDSETAPDFTLKVGYSSFQFPLKQGAFPTTRYGMLDAGGAFTIPFVPQFALIVGGAYEQRLGIGMKTNTKLGKVGSQMGFRADGGIRLFFDPIEIMAFGRFEQFSSSYTGTTSLANSQTQYSNVSMTDRYYGGFGTVGVAF